MAHTFPLKKKMAQRAFYRADLDKCICMPRYCTSAGARSAARTLAPPAGEYSALA
jgi:hypothetical protein